MINFIKSFARRHNSRYIIPRVKFEELYPEINQSRLTLEHIPATQASVRMKELIYIAFLAQRKPDCRFFEFGTSLGRTTLNVALNLSTNGHVYSLDLPTDYEVDDTNRYLPRQEFEVKELEHALLLKPYLNELPITLLHGESTAFDFSQWFGQMDVVFIDGGHTRTVVEKDSENAFKLLRPSGGIILWHDYLWESCPDVVEYLNQINKHYSLYHLIGTKTVLFTSENGS